ncbi:MAG: hypothetical protein GY861_10360 [bacterium]|nr:hypothetical protein [bacterium]
MRAKFITVPTIITTVMMAMSPTNVMADSTGFGVGYTSADVGGNSQSVANKGVITTDSMFDIGFGLGIPYGVLGVNAEYYPIDNISVSAGLGTTLLAGAGYDVGVQYYFGNKGDGWVPRVSAHYGTNALIYWNRSGNEDGESFDGVSAGLGLKYVKGNSKWIVDLFYAVTSDVFDRVDELEARGYDVSTYGLEKVRLGVGYSYSF